MWREVILLKSNQVLLNQEWKQESLTCHMIEHPVEVRVKVEAKAKAKYLVNFKSRDIVKVQEK